MVKDLGRVNAFPENNQQKKEADIIAVSASFFVCEAL